MSEIMNASNNDYWVSMFFCPGTRQPCFSEKRLAWCNPREHCFDSRQDRAVAYTTFACGKLAKEELP